MSIKRQVECGQCGGGGVYYHGSEDSYDAVQCAQCGGLGWIEEETPTDQSEVMYDEGVCPGCGSNLGFPCPGCGYH